MEDTNDLTNVSNPFDVNYKTSKPGQAQLPARWKVPFDEDYREIETPNVESAALPAYASLGYHVVRNMWAYVPAYRIIGSIALQASTPRALLEAWTESTKNDAGVVVVDRRNSMAYHLRAAVSNQEAVTSWYVREHGHEGTVLCLDRREGKWYIESTQTELIVSLGADGTEVPADEAGGEKSYLLSAHPNAIMMYGE